MTRSSGSSTRRGRASALGSPENRSSARSRTTTAWAIATFGGSRNYSERVPEPDAEYVGVRPRIAAARGPFLTASARERLANKAASAVSWLLPAGTSRQMCSCDVAARAALQPRPARMRCCWVSIKAHAPRPPTLD
jgi:hypothetical protein